MKNQYLAFDVLLISSRKGVATRASPVSTGVSIVALDALPDHGSESRDIDKMARDSIQDFLIRAG